MGHEVWISAEREIPQAAEEQLRRAVLAALEGEGVETPCIVEVVVTDDEDIRETNRQARGVDRPTDVLSFPANNVLVVKGEREYLIPAVGAVIVDTDLDSGVMTVHVLKGMATDEN